MNEPPPAVWSTTQSRNDLATLIAAVREFSTDGLLDLRNQFTATHEDSTRVMVIDCELCRRSVRMNRRK